jgi:branched-subunit amino acid transport protein
VAGPLALALVLGLASLSFIMRATGAFLPNLPAAVTERMAGLAPALLAALVAIQLTGPNGLVHLDVKVPAVLVAALLAALRAPFILCVIAGALVAALLRAVFHVP